MHTLHSLSRRCVECPPIQPACPVCEPDESCSLQSQSCDACASTICVKIGSLPGQAAPKKSTPLGPIIGGVVGGVVAIIIAVFCLWYFGIRPRRKRANRQSPEKRDPSTLTALDNRAHSIASTVLTRASNVIQIAYIPGVTGRSPPSTPTVPRMPDGMPTGSPAGTPGLEQHFFVPSNLRDSQVSDLTSVGPRFSIAPSLARTSMAMTDRGDTDVPPVPAQIAYRGQANAVSVRPGTASGSGGSTESTTPPQSQPGPPVDVSKSSIVARQVIARPIEVKKGARIPTLANLARHKVKSQVGRSNLSTVTTGHVDEKDLVVNSTVAVDVLPSPLSVKSKLGESDRVVASLSSVSAILPADGPIGSGKSGRRRPSEDLTAMIEDAISRAVGDPSQSPRPGCVRKDSGPFSDDNEI